MNIFYPIKPSFEIKLLNYIFLNLMKIIIIKYYLYIFKYLVSKDKVYKFYF